jgi:proteasome-associated ATPase
VSYGFGRSTADLEIEHLRIALKDHEAELRRLQSAPASIGYVVSANKDRVLVTCPGRLVDVEPPKKTLLRAGDCVRVAADTGAILERLEETPLPVGMLHDVVAVHGSHVEIAMPNGRRLVLAPMVCDVGDRVLVDENGFVVVAKVPAPASSMAVIQPTGVTWADIGGLEEAKAALEEAIVGPVKNAAAWKRFGRKPPRGVLLSGPPGCGKTMLGKAAATALAELHGAKSGGYVYVKGPEVLDRYVGASEAAVRKLFDDARRHKREHGFPAIIFLDEADALLGRRNHGAGVTLHMANTIVPAFLAELDGLEDAGAIVLLATNRPDALDPAVVRDGRIDRRIAVTRPTKEDSEQIAQRLLEGRPTSAPDFKDDAGHLGRALVHRLWSERHVLATVKRVKGKPEPLLLRHKVSGALIAGLVERATSSAMRRAADGIAVQDLDVAVAEAWKEQLDVSHDDELAELVQDFADDVAGITYARAR